MYRNIIVGESTMVSLNNGKSSTYINFDNAATTPPFKTVLEEINKFSEYYSSVHRGAGYKSILSSQIYDEARQIVLDFLKGDSDYHTVIFLKNTTEAINKLSYRLNHFLKDKILLTTYMEHHSNMLPWTCRYETDFVDIDDVGRLSMDDLESKLQNHRGKVGLVAVTGASNVTGYLNPIYDIARLCHKYKAKILVDGAQLIPHGEFNMKPKDSPEHIDFLAFSAHKLYAPFGTGVLVGPKDCFQEGYSEQVGGGIVKFVSPKNIIWEDPPTKEEAGTPNLMGVLALSTSIKTINSLNMKKVEEYERELTYYALQRMKDIPNIIIYDDFNINKKVSIISFNIKGLYHETVAEILSQEGGIAVRSGCFCAHPYVQRLLKISDEEMMKYRDDESLPKPGMVRVSFGLYNNYEEIYSFIHILNKIGKDVDYYREKYNR